MCIRDRNTTSLLVHSHPNSEWTYRFEVNRYGPVSYTHLRAHETKANLVCRLLLAKKNRIQKASHQRGASFAEILESSCASMTCGIRTRPSSFAAGFIPRLSRNGWGTPPSPWRWTPTLTSFQACRKKLPPSWMPFCRRPLTVCPPLVRSLGKRAFANGGLTGQRSLVRTRLGRG